MIAYLADSVHLAADSIAHRRLRPADDLMLLIQSTRRSSLGDRTIPVVLSVLGTL